MNGKEKQELKSLHVLWACQKATKKQILRCMDLEHKAKFENNKIES